MELLKEIASVSGKSGLFKVIKPTRNGVILETLDANKSKSIINNSVKMSILSDISVYITGVEENLPLAQVFKKMHEKVGANIMFNAKSDEKDLKLFFESVLPEYDKERVYLSDIKKIISWYVILINHVPELFIEKEDTSSKDEEVEKQPKIAVKEASSKSERPKITKPKSALKPKAAPAVNKAAASRASKKGG